LTMDDAELRRSAAPGSLQEDSIFQSLARRARPGERPEELLFDLGLIDEQDFALELAGRAGRPFTGLRGFMPDLRLFVYLPLPIALRERVCPLLLVGGSLPLSPPLPTPDLAHLAPCQSLQRSRWERSGSRNADLSH